MDAREEAPEETRRLVARLYRAISAGDEEDWLACFALGAVYRWSGRGGAACGREQLRQFFRAARAAVPILCIREHHHSADEPRALVRWAAEGTTWDGRP